MNIAFLNSIEKETYGGMEEWIRLVSTGLTARGHHISLLGRPDSRFLDRAGHNLPSARKLRLNISGDFDPIVIGKIRRHLADEDIDILCVNFNKDVRLGGIAARLRSETKVVWSLGMNIARDKLSHRALTPRLVDSVIVPSQSLKTEILRYGFFPEDRIGVIPIGIEDVALNEPKSEYHGKLRTKYSLPPHAIVAVTAARFVYKKGHEYLIEAAPRILGHFPNLYFLFLGSGPKEPVLREHISRLNLKDRFVFAGMLENVDLELAGSDLMIHPSKEEPFGIALLEAMRAGLPICASRVGGIPEVVVDGKTAVLFEPRDPAALAQAVKDMLSDTDRMERLGQNGRHRWAERFSYEEMIDRVENTLTAVIGHENRTIKNKSA